MEASVSMSSIRGPIKPFVLSAKQIHLFSEGGRALTSKPMATGIPWYTYLGMANKYAHAISSDTLGGRLMGLDAKLQARTAYFFGHTPDTNGLYFYIKNKTTNTVWSAGEKPVITTPVERLETTHGADYTLVRSQMEGIDCQVVRFIPAGEDEVLIDRVTLVNNTAEPVELELHSLVQFCKADNFEGDTMNGQRTNHIAETQIRKVDGATVVDHLTEYEHGFKKGFTSHMAVGEVEGVATNFWDWQGVHAGLVRPNALFQPGYQYPNKPTEAGQPCAAEKQTVKLMPGQSITKIFLTTHVENTEADKFTPEGEVNTSRADALLAKYGTLEAVDAEYERLWQNWTDKFGIFQVTTNNPKLNMVTNVLEPFQVSVTGAMSRSASETEAAGRGMGTRDSGQDSLATAVLDPAFTRERLYDLMATQRPDGSYYHQYQPLTKRGNKDIGDGFMDDSHWFLQAVSNYVRQTGDIAFLNETIPYTESQESGTVLDHLNRGIEYMLKHLGPHGLPLIGHSDWNDCLNLIMKSAADGGNYGTVGFQCAATTKPIEETKAESTMIAGLFLYGWKQASSLFRLMGQTARADEIDTHAKAMEEALLTHGWDGEWWLRAYQEDGTKVGSKESQYGNCHLEPIWCVLAGVGADQGLPQIALDSIHKHLDSPFGVKLASPAYQKPSEKLGEITVYPPGFKENCSIFVHAATWAILANLQQGNADRAMELLQKLHPAMFTDERLNLFRGAPDNVCQTISSDEAKKEGSVPGVGTNDWLTGGAAWIYVILTQNMFGVQPDIEGLRLDPCLPTEVRKDPVVIDHTLRGTKLKITIEPSDVPKGVKKMVLDGKTEIEGNYIPYEMFADGGEHTITVTMGQ